MTESILLTIVAILLGGFIVAIVIAVTLFNARMVTAMNKFERIDNVLAAYSNAAALLETDLRAHKIDSVPVKEHVEQLVILKNAYDPDEPEHMLLGRTIRFIEKKLAENSQLRERLQAAYLHIESQRMIAEERRVRQRDICEDAGASAYFTTALGVGAGT